MANEAAPPSPIEQAIADALGPASAAQRFFKQLAASIITPHVGDQYRDIIKNVLLRATEAGLFDPDLK